MSAAHIGLTTIPLAQNGAVQCIAIEPDPTNFGFLSENVSHNCTAGNVTLHQLALFHRPGVLDLELDPDNLGDHRVRLETRPGKFHEETRAVVKVEATTLDALIENPVPPLAIKLDCQGAEPFIFQGGGRTLALAELIIMEWWPYGMARLGADPQCVTSLITKNFKSISVLTGDTRIVPTTDVSMFSDQLLRDFENQAADTDAHMDLMAIKG
jgi:FkbM family methyltransferase